MIKKISRLKIYKNHKKNLSDPHNLSIKNFFAFFWNKKVVLICSLVLFLRPVLAVIDNNGINDDQHAFKESDITTTQTILTRQGLLDPSFILDLLNQIKAKGIIDKPFFLRTNSLHYRIVQDLPFLSIDNNYPVERREVVPFGKCSISTFYTHISHALFSNKGDYLKEYLALDDQTVIASLHDVIMALNNLNDQFYFDTVQVFNALKNGYVEQRRAGILVSLGGALGECSITGSIPLYYLERNFQLSQKDKDTLEKKFGATTKKQQEEFKKHHLISDKFGVGDMRVQVALPLAESWKEHLKISLFTTIPLGGAFVKGILGSSFKGYSDVPILDLNNLITMVIAGEQQQAFETVNNLGLHALDRLSATLLEQSLTNERHFTLGMGVVNKIKLKDFFKASFFKKWYWNYNFSCEYYIPSNHHRSFINKIDQKTIAGIDFVSPLDPAATLAIFTQEALDRFFLRSFKAKIHPGIIVHSHSTFIYKHDKWRLWLGSDVWFKSAEKVVFLDASSATQTMLDRYKVKNNYALALSSVGGCLYKYEGESRSFSLGIDLYSTYFTRGIGKEMGIALRFETRF